MPISYHVDPARQLVEVTASGEVTLRDLEEHFRTRAADPAFSPSFDALVDFRAVTSAPSPEEMRHLARVVPNWLQLERSRRAVVAAVDEVFTSARILEAYTAYAAPRYRAFRTMDEAIRWLKSGGWRGP